jgi:hypothetical protein
MLIVLRFIISRSIFLRKPLHIVFSKERHKKTATLSGRMRNPIPIRSDQYGVPDKFRSCF